MSTGKINLPAAQLMCYGLEPVGGIVELPNAPKGLNEPEDKLKTAKWFSLKVNCTLTFRKELDSKLEDGKGKRATHCTDEGLIITEELPDFRISNTISAERKDNTFYFDATRPLQVPMLKCVTATGDVQYFIHYTDEPDEPVIEGLFYGKFPVTTKNLYKNTSAKVRPSSAGSIEIPALFDVPLPLTERGPNGFVAPIKQSAVTKVSEQVAGASSLTVPKVAEALTRQNIENVIGVAMQRINRNQQGDLMLYDGI